MVKKNLVNKNVIRALSIGLSLAMASQPLTAMAAEPDAQPAADLQPVAQAPAEESKTAAEQAEDKLAEVKEAVEAEETGAVAKANDAVSQAQDLGIKADKKTKVDPVQEVKDDLADIENGKKIAGVETALQGITSETEGEGLLPGLEAGVNTAAGKVEGVVKDAEKAVFGDLEEEDADADADEAEEKAESLDSKLTNAETKVGEASEKIAGAKTIGEANAAYDEAAGAVEDADTAVKAAEEAVETAEKELEVKEDEYTSLAEQYEAALKAYNDKVDALNQKKAAALEALVGSAATDKKDAVDGLQDELEALYAEDEQEIANAAASLEVLKKAVAAAEKAYKKQGYGYIAALENVIIARNGVTYGTGSGDLNRYSDVENVNPNSVTYRRLFRAIVETYYVPEVVGEGWTFASLTALPFPEGTDPNNYYYNGDTTNDTNKSTPGDVLRVFDLLVKDEQGNEKHIYLNYKTATEGLDSSRDHKNVGYNGIVIFEKTEHRVLEGKDIDNLTISENNGTVVKLNGENALFKDGKFYYQDAEGKFTVLVQNGEKTVDVEQVTDSAKVDLTTVTKGVEKSETDVLENTEEVSYSYENGRVTKTVKNSITTTSYTGRELSSKAAYTESLDEAKKEYLTQLQGQITGLRDNQTIVINGVEYDNTFVIPDDADACDYGFEVETGDRTKTKVDTIGYQVEVEYKSDFVKTVNVDREYSWEIIKAWVKLESPKSNMKKRARNDEENAFKNALSSEFTYDGRGSDDLDAEWHVFKAGTVDGTIDFKYHRTNNTKKIVSVYYNDQIKDQTAAKTAAEGNAQVTGTTNIGNNTTEKKTVVGSTVKDPITRTTYPVVTIYGYKTLNFILKEVSTSTEKQVTYQESWAVDAETEHTEYRNDNWYEGNVISISVNDKNEFVNTYKTDGKGQGGQKDETVTDTDKVKYTDLSKNLITKINDAKAKIAQYEAAKQAVQDAEDQVKEAEEKVAELEVLIGKIEFSKKDSILEGLRGRLKEAKDELEDAKERRDQLLEDLEKLDGQRDQKVIDLTPAPSTGGDEGGADEDTTGGTVIVTDALAGPAPAAAGLVAGPVAGGAGAPAAPAVAAAGEGQGLTNFNNQPVAQSASVPTAENTETQQFDPGKTALAAAPINEETIGWWWLLIIAVLGGSGYAMYKKFQAKKEEKTEK